MKHTILYIVLATCLTTSCLNKTADNAVKADSTKTTSDEALLTDAQFKELNIHTGPVPQHLFTEGISVTGKLACMPQSMAAVTSPVGANVTRILVKEGETVRKGQVLAWASHPDLLDLQSRYLNVYNQLQYTTKDYQRQQKLYEQKIGSGKDFQKIQSDYNSLSGEEHALSAQLRLIGINPVGIRSGKTVSRIPLVSPISGTIEKVDVETGQFADPQKELFHIVNTDNIYADLLVFERDLGKIRVGQSVEISSPAAAGLKLTGKIYSIGSSFEENPRAVHVRANIVGSHSGLVNGMYLKGLVKTERSQAPAMLEEGTIEEAGQDFVFVVRKSAKGWAFKPVRVNKGRNENGYVEIKLNENLPPNAQLALDNAYYLMSELKKGETGEDN